MITYRAFFRSFCTNYNVSAIATFPHCNATLLKHFHSFNILKKCTISFFMKFFNRSNTSELSG